MKMGKEELIDMYLTGELSAEEEREFHRLLREDPSFEKEVEFQRNLQIAIQDRERSLLKRKLQEYEKEIGKGPLNLWKSLAIAASVVLILASGWLLYHNFNAGDPETLYVSNYEKYPNTYVSITRGENTEDSTLLEAFEAYESGDNDKAIYLLETINQSNPEDFIDFYLAQSYLNDGNLIKSRQIFKDLVSKGGAFKAESLWYLSLNYLKAENIKDAAESLRLLIENGGYKKEEAITLLNALP